MHVRPAGVVEQRLGHLVGGRYEIHEAGGNHAGRHARLRRRVRRLRHHQAPFPLHRPGTQGAFCSNTGQDDGDGVGALVRGQRDAGNGQSCRAGRVESATS